MKIMVGDSIVDLNDTVSVKTPLGIYTARLLDLHESSSDNVIAAEVSGGNLVIENGIASDIAIRGHLDILVLKDMKVSYLEAKVFRLILINTSIEQMQTNVDEMIEISGSSIGGGSIKSDNLKRLYIRHSTLSNLKIRSDTVDSLVLYGTKKKPIQIIGGDWHIKHVGTMWVSGNQRWHDGYRLEIEDYEHFLGESLKYVFVEDAYIPRWLEIVIAYRDVEREFSEIL